MTGQEFRDYVIRTFKRTDKDTDIYEATTDVIKMLIMSHPFDDYATVKTDASIAAPATAFSFTLPTDFLCLTTDVQCIDSSDGSGWDLKKLPWNVFQARFASYYADTTLDAVPHYYAVHDDSIHIGPRPDKSTYVYRFSYTMEQTAEITSATANVPFTDKYRKVLKHFVLGSLHQDLENLQLAQYHNSVASDLYAILIDLEKKNTDAIRNVTFQNI